MAVGPDIAIPVGLIVTEAVSSALNHNFSGVAAPEIRIEAADKAGTVELTIEDNGVETAAARSARRARRLRPDADPRTGHAARRRGTDIAARGRRNASGR